jgi:DNA invertase Pin-like site-specific DNA recombinase
MGDPRKAVAYLRTSSAANVGEDKDSDKRQRAAIAAYAKRRKIEVVAEFYDAAVSGADPVDQRPGFADLLNRIESNGIGRVLVESPDRFARDLTVQLVGHDQLKAMGVELVPANAPEFFTDETPTAVMVRQILGAVSQFQKAELVAKLKAARERTGNLGGPDRYPEEVIKLAKRLTKRKLSLRKISNKLEEAGHLNANDKPYAAQSIKNMIK